MLDDIKKTIWARASKIFTAHERLFQRAAAHLKPGCRIQVAYVSVKLLQAGA